MSDRVARRSVRGLSYGPSRGRCGRLPADLWILLCVLGLAAGCAPDDDAARVERLAPGGVPGCVLGMDETGEAHGVDPDAGREGMPVDSRGESKPWEERRTGGLAALAGRNTRVCLGGEDNRWFIALHPGSSRLIPLGELPRFAHLSMGLACIAPGRSTGGEVRVDLVLHDGNEGQPAVASFPLVLAPSVEAASWSDHVVSLERWAGREVVLEVIPVVRGSRAGTGQPSDDDVFVLIGAPMLVSGLHRTSPDCPNLIVISLAGLRADRVGVYGCPRPTTVRLDSLAREGVVVERVWSPTASRRPSLASLLTGQFPATHGLGRQVRQRAASTPGAQGADRRSPLLVEQISPTLAEILARSGYATLAMTSGGAHDTRAGLARGFDRYTTNDPFCTGTRPDPTGRGMERLLKALDRFGDAPFFLFVETSGLESFDPAPLDLVVLGVDRPDELLGRREALLAKIEAGGQGARAEDGTDLSMLYEATLRGLDRVLGRLFDELARRELTGRTLLVVTSSHGKEFFEHGGLGSGRTLYEEQLRVPLLFSGGGLDRGRRAPGPMGLVDLAPTLLSLLGLEAEERMQGHDLSAMLRGGSGLSGSYLASLDRNDVQLIALQQGRYKLIRRQRNGAVREQRPDEIGWTLFDLLADPAETTDVKDRYPQVFHDLWLQMRTEERQQLCLRASLLRSHRNGSNRSAQRVASKASR